MVVGRDLVLNNFVLQPPHPRLGQGPPRKLLGVDMRRLPEGLDNLFSLLQRQGHQLLLGASRALNSRVNCREDAGVPALAAVPAADDALHHFFDYLAYMFFTDVLGHALFLALGLITDVTQRYGTYPLAPFLRGRGNQGSPPRVGEGSGEGSNRLYMRNIS